MEPFETVVKIVLQNDTGTKVVWFKNVPFSVKGAELLAKAAGLSDPPFQFTGWETEWFEEVPYKILAWNWENV